MPLEPSPPSPWSPELVRELIDESASWPRYECLDGQLLVTPAPRVAHQVAHSRVFALLQAYVDRFALGLVLSSPSEITIGPRALVQPDLFVLPPTVHPPVRDWKQVTSLLLAVEILSPSTARRDRGIKRSYYQRIGVPEYWIVDLDAGLVERWRPADERPEIATDHLEWRPGPEHPALRIELRALFNEIERWAGQPDD